MPLLHVSFTNVYIRSQHKWLLLALCVVVTLQSVTTLLLAQLWASRLRVLYLIGRAHLLAHPQFDPSVGVAHCTPTTGTLWLA